MQSIRCFLVLLLISKNVLSFVMEDDYPDEELTTEQSDFEEIDRIDSLISREQPDPIKFRPFEMRNCKDLLKQGYKSGLYKIYPFQCCHTKSIAVYCDMETDGGGWTVIQRRIQDDVQENFNRTWMQYALGFGDLRKEFWLGLDNIHALTDQKLNEIYFHLEDFDGEKKYAKYEFFYVHNRENEFELEVEGYEGNAGDSFIPKANRMKFSTWDKDLDKWSNSCALKYVLISIVFCFIRSFS